MDPLPISSRLILPPEELDVSFARGGGPGGQNVNKVASKVLLRFNVRESKVLGEDRRRLIATRLSSRITSAGEILIQASEYREQARNLEAARERLAALIRGALTPEKKRRATRPTRGSKLRRLDSKRQRSETKRNRTRKHHDE